MGLHTLSHRRLVSTTAFRLVVFVSQFRIFRRFKVRYNLQWRIWENHGAWVNPSPDEAKFLRSKCITTCASRSLQKIWFIISTNLTRPILKVEFFPKITFELYSVMRTSREGEGVYFKLRQLRPANQIKMIRISTMTNSEGDYSPIQNQRTIFHSY